MEHRRVRRAARAGGGAGKPHRHHRRGERRILLHGHLRPTRQSGTRQDGLQSRVPGYGGHARLGKGQDHPVPGRVLRFLYRGAVAARARAVRPGRHAPRREPQDRTGRLRKGRGRPDRVLGAVYA